MKVKEPEIEVIDLQTELQVFDPVAAQIAEMKEKNASLVFDYEDKEGNKNARSHIAVLRRLKKPITETHRLAKAEAKKFCDALDDKKRELIGVVEEMIKVHHEPVWEIEQREAAIEAERLLEIQQARDAEEAARQAELEAREKAAAEKEAELAAKQAELDRKEREAQLVADAEERAIAKAQQDLVDAENRRIADVQREKDKAAAEAAEKEKELAEEKRIQEIEEARKRKAEADRQANVKHRLAVHTDIYNHIKGITDDPTAGIVFTALRDGQVPHVTIQY